MDACSPKPQPPCDASPSGPDDVSVRRWFIAYAAVFAAACVVVVVLAGRQGQTLSAWTSDPIRAFTESTPIAKLAGFAGYLSLCCTFLPLPTGWAVAAVATRQAAVADNLMATMLLVAAAGAVGSTLANLNDYHLFTWLLRRRRIASVRDTSAHRAAARWFAKAPFAILVVFNLVPIPVDIVRMLATSCRYSRWPFAAANFIGRFLRYGVIAFVTYRWNLGWLAVVALLGLAIILGMLRLLSGMVRKLSARRQRNTLSQIKL